MKCPVCQSSEYVLFDQDKKRSYFKCSDCTLVFVPREQILSAADESNRYEAHQNSEDDPYYKKYLTDIAQETLPFLHSESFGLDFGCGKTKLLASIYEERGIQMDSFDLYFHPDESIWKKTYNFIILSEVIEHLAAPKETMESLNSLLKTGGEFFIKTKFYPESSEDFSNWFYKRDMTHVEFFNEKSMETLAQKLGKSFQKIGNDLYRLT